MKVKYGFQSALRAMRAHKSRSLLTILGITIGILSIIMVMSLGKGAEGLILSQIQGLGSKSIIISPGRQPKGLTDPSILDSLSNQSLTDRDLILLSKKSNVPDAVDTMPIVVGVATASRENQNYRITIIGATQLISKIYDIQPSLGNFFTDDDVRGRNSVVVIGSKVEEKLFGSTPALGQQIRIKGRNFRVIGILPKKGQLSFINFDETVAMPHTTAQQYIFGAKYFHHIVVQVDSEQNIPQAVKDINITLRNSHGITDPAKDDFYLQTQAEITSMVSTITNVLTLFLGSIAAISLIVGGIGIMNIMLVSVTERTREIGLRKALGATDSNILSQFLIESVMLTAVGGLAGILLGATFSLLVSVILTKILGVNWAFNLSLSAIILGLGVAGLIGLVFGLYPARRASLKSPIEALRYE
ncbi:MAG: ABC transporter permease [Patescibacteria group bacterium]|nr:ABC transporter permease [Patescibacteria group bacterium]